MIYLIALILSLALIIGSVLGFVANSRVSQLRRQVAQLSRRVELLTQNGRTEAPQVNRPAPPREIAAALTAPAPEIIEPEPALPAQALPLQKQSAPVSESKKPKKARRSFEEELGARWAVWVGGIALLLGAVFLLRYTIEAGFFTPAMRVAMAALLGSCLLAGGEWLRRHDKVLARARENAPDFFDKTDIPGVLTGAGIFTLLGTVFAAYELYGFMGSVPAFILMASISLGAMALGLLHGPKISAMGLLASFATPLLIQTDDPNFYALFGYLTLISLASWALARFRQWGWLELGALAGGLFWLFMAATSTAPIGHFITWFAFLGLGLAASTYFVAKPNGDDSKFGDLPLFPTPPWSVLWTALAAIALLITFDTTRFTFNQGVFVAALFIFVLIAIAVYVPRLVHKMAVATLFALGFFVRYFYPGTLTMFPQALFLGALIGGGYFLWQITERKNDLSSGFIKFCGAFAPVVIAASVLPFENATNKYHVLIAFLLMAGLLALAGKTLRSDDDDTNHYFSPYPWAAGLAYLCGTIYGFDNLHLALALMAGIALFGALGFYFKRHAYRMVAVFMAGVTGAFVLLSEVHRNGALSDTAIFNELWIYLALPAALCFGVSRLLDRNDRDLASEILKAGALIFTALFFVFQIRHYLYGGDIGYGRFTFDEIALQVVTGLCFTLGGAYMRIGQPNFADGKTNSQPRYLQLLPSLMMLISLITLSAFVLLLCFGLSPLFNAGQDVTGGKVLNSLILGYALPAVLMGGSALLSRGHRPDLWVRLLAVLTLVAALWFITAEIRHIFSGPGISIFENFPKGTETYVISASWLIFGIVLLAAGLKWDFKSLRLGSAVVLVLTVFKAFLVDMATLEGVLRAVSFVILGLVLIVIGRVYQKILFESR